jgi:protein gp37
MINLDTGRYWDLGWKIVSGCTRCSEGCRNCWALAMEKRFHKGVEGTIEVHPERLSVPLKRKKPTVWSLWNDLYHSHVTDDFKIQAYRMMEDCPQHTFLILTKRPHLMQAFLSTVIDYFNIEITDRPLAFPNIWHGLTVCNQQEADEKIPVFLQIPGKKFLSIEPCLGEIDISFYLTHVMGATYREDKIHHPVDAVILGSETGPRARPMELNWARSVRDQCENAGVPFFLKHINKKDGRMLDGRYHNDLPWHKGEA